MELNISVSPEAIEKAVTEAVIASAIGKRMEEQIREGLRKYDLNLAIQDEAKRVVLTIVREAVMNDEQFRARAKEIVLETLTDEVVRTIASGVFKQLLDSEFDRR